MKHGEQGSLQNRIGLKQHLPLKSRQIFLCLKKTPNLTPFWFKTITPCSVLLGLFLIIFSQTLIKGLGSFPLFLFQCFSFLVGWFGVVSGFGFLNFF